MDEINTENLQFTGGALTGFINTSWPLARLIVSKDKVDLKIKFLFINSNYSFSPENIISIEAYKGIFPIVGRGLKINHNVQSYPKTIIFYTFKKPSFIIDEIKNKNLLNSVVFK